MARSPELESRVVDVLRRGGDWRQGGRAFDVGPNLIQRENAKRRLVVLANILPVLFARHGRAT